MKPFEGRCLCGGVRYAATPPTLFFAHCHCRWCREAHGAAFVSWVGLAEERFRLRDPEGLLRWYQSTEQSRRGFCSRCGTTLFFASILCPGEIHVTRASMPAEIDREPQLHCFYDQHVAWASVGDDLPRYDSSADGLAKYRAVKSRGCVDGPGAHAMSESLPTLVSRGLRLRQLTQADVAHLFEVFSDPRVMRYWSRDPMQHLDEARQLLEDIDAGRRCDTLYQWGIEPDGLGRIVGTTTLFQISTTHRRGEIGFALGSAWWGRGIAKAAVTRLVAHAFETLNLARLEADADPRNAASLGLLERLGFRREGLLRARYRVAGEVQDAVLLGLLREEWTPATTVAARMAPGPAGH